MKKIVFLLIIMTLTVSALAFASNASSMNNVIGTGKNTYKISVYTANVKRAGTNSDITYKMTFGTGDHVKYIELDDPETDQYDRYERNQVDTFYLKTDGMVLNSLRIESDGSGRYSGWKIDSVIVESQFTTPKGKSVYDKVTFKVDKWMSDCGNSLYLVPAKAGGLFSVSVSTDINFGYCKMSSRVQSCGIYRILNYEACNSKRSTMKQLELAYDCSPANRTVFSVGFYIDPLPGYFTHDNRVDSESPAFVVSIADSFYEEKIEFLNIRTSMKISSAVLNSPTLKTISFGNADISEITEAYPSNTVKNLIINNTSSEQLPQWLANGMPNLSCVYLSDDAFWQYQNNMSEFVNSFNSNVKFCCSPRMKEAVDIKYPEYTDRFEISEKMLYSGSIYSETTGGASIAGWIVAGAELIVIAALAVVIVKKKRVK